MLIIPGFTPDDQVPGVVAHSEWGAGPISIGAIPLTCVLYGNKGDAGTAAVNVRTPVTTDEEADAFFEPRSELARMAHAALAVPGVARACRPVAEGVGAVSAFLKLHFSGSWTVSGELGFQFDEQPVRVNIAASHPPDTAAEAVAAAFNQAQNGRLFGTAVAASGVVTIEVFSKGRRGNQHRAFMTTTLKPAGMNVSFEQYTPIA